MPHRMQDWIQWVASSVGMLKASVDQPGAETQKRDTVATGFSWVDNNWSPNEAMATAALTVCPSRPNCQRLACLNHMDPPAVPHTLSLLVSTVHLQCKSLRVHKGSLMTPEPWLVAAQDYTQTSRHVQSCLFFGCYSSSIFSGGVMSSVLDLEKRKASGLGASVKAKCNDRTMGEVGAPSTFQVYICVSIINQLSSLSHSRMEQVVMQT